MAEGPAVLVIDDEEIVRISCERILSPLGYEVDSAASGLEGVEMLRKRQYDLVLTDLKMPDMDGLEVMSRVRRLRPEAKVIIITGYSTVELAVKAMREGAFNYIEKPFNPDTLTAAVKEALGEGRGRQRA